MASIVMNTGEALDRIRETLQNPATIDPLLTPSIIEFLLTLPDVDDRLIESLLAIISFPSRGPVLRKRLLLRRLRSDPAASELSVETLELLEGLDGGEGAASPALAAAYVAVAANCSMRRMKEGKGFEEAVRRLWTGVNVAVSGRPGLRSAELDKWEGLMKKALWDRNTRRLVMSVDTQRKAVDAVTDYLHEALQEIGKPKLDVAADIFLRRVGVDTGSSMASAMDLPAVAADVEEPALEDIGVPMPEVTVDVHPSRTINEGIRCADVEEAASVEIGVPMHEVAVDAHSSERIGEVVGRADVQKTASEEIGVPMLEVAADAHSSRRIGQGIGRADVEEATSEEIGALMLEVVVDDHPSGRIGKGIRRDDVQEAALEEIEVPMLEVATDAHPSKRIGEGVGRVDADVVAQHTEDVQEKMVVEREYGSTEEDNVPFNNKQHNLPRDEPVALIGDDMPNKRQSKRGDDYVDLTLDGSQDTLRSSRLRSLRKRKLAPLNPSGITKSPRRRRKLWTDQEEDVLDKAVRRYGVGKWKFILNCYPTVFEGRTEVDLKDKWRNMSRCGHS